jgi:hypothetical protein
MNPSPNHACQARPGDRLGALGAAWLRSPLLIRIRTEEGGGQEARVEGGVFFRGLTSPVFGV